MCDLGEKKVVENTPCDEELSCICETTKPCDYSKYCICEGDICCIIIRRHSPSMVCCTAIRAWALFLKEVSNNIEIWNKWCYKVLNDIHRMLSLQAELWEWKSFVRILLEDIKTWQSYKKHLDDLGEKIASYFINKDVSCCTLCLKDYIHYDNVDVHHLAPEQIEAIDAYRYWRQLLSEMILECEFKKIHDSASQCCRQHRLTHSNAGCCFRKTSCIKKTCFKINKRPSSKKNSRRKLLFHSLILPGTKAVVDRSMLTSKQYCQLLSNPKRSICGSLKYKKVKSTPRPLLCSQRLVRLAIPKRIRIRETYVNYRDRLPALQVEKLYNTLTDQTYGVLPSSCQAIETFKEKRSTKCLSKEERQKCRYGNVLLEYNVFNYSVKIADRILRKKTRHSKLEGILLAQNLLGSLFMYNYLRYVPPINSNDQYDKQLLKVSKKVAAIIEDILSCVDIERYTSSLDNSFIAKIDKQIQRAMTQTSSCFERSRTFTNRCCSYVPHITRECCSKYKKRINCRRVTKKVPEIIITEPSTNRLRHSKETAPESDDEPAPSLPKAQLFTPYIDTNPVTSVSSKTESTKSSTETASTAKTTARSSREPSRKVSHNSRASTSTRSRSTKSSVLPTLYKTKQGISPSMSNQKTPKSSMELKQRSISPSITKETPSSKNILHTTQRKQRSSLGIRQTSGADHPSSIDDANKINTSNIKIAKTNTSSMHVSTEEQRSDAEPETGSKPRRIATKSSNRISTSKFSTTKISQRKESLLATNRASNTHTARQKSSTTKSKLNLEATNRKALSPSKKPSKYVALKESLPAPSVATHLPEQSPTSRKPSRLFTTEQARLSFITDIYIEDGTLEGQEIPSSELLERSLFDITHNIEEESETSDTPSSKETVTISSRETDKTKTESTTPVPPAPTVKTEVNTTEDTKIMETKYKLIAILKEYQSCVGRESNLFNENELQNLSLDNLIEKIQQILCTNKIFDKLQTIIYEKISNYIKETSPESWDAKMNDLVSHVSNELAVKLNSCECVKGSEPKPSCKKRKYNEFDCLNNFLAVFKSHTQGNDKHDQFSRNKCILSHSDSIFPEEDFQKQGVPQWMKKTIRCLVQALQYFQVEVAKHNNVQETTASKNSCVCLSTVSTCKLSNVPGEECECCASVCNACDALCPCNLVKTPIIECDCCMTSPINCCIIDKGERGGADNTKDIHTVHTFDKKTYQKYKFVNNLRQIRGSTSHPVNIHRNRNNKNFSERFFSDRTSQETIFNINIHQNNSIGDTKSDSDIPDDVFDERYLIAKKKLRSLSGKYSKQCVDLITFDDLDDESDSSIKVGDLIEIDNKYTINDDFDKSNLYHSMLKTKLIDSKQTETLSFSEILTKNKNFEKIKESILDIQANLSRIVGILNEKSEKIVPFREAIKEPEINRSELTIQKSEFELVSITPNSSTSFAGSFTSASSILDTTSSEMTERSDTIKKGSSQHSDDSSNSKYSDEELKVIDKTSLYSKSSNSISTNSGVEKILDISMVFTEKTSSRDQSKQLETKKSALDFHTELRFRDYEYELQLIDQIEKAIHQLKSQGLRKIGMDQSSKIENIEHSSVKKSQKCSSMIEGPRVLQVLRL